MFRIQGLTGVLVFRRQDNPGLEHGTTPVQSHSQGTQIEGGMHRVQLRQEYTVFGRRRQNNQVLGHQHDELPGNHF